MPTVRRTAAPGPVATPTQASTIRIADFADSRATEQAWPCRSSAIERCARDDARDQMTETAMTEGRLRLVLKPPPQPSPAARERGRCGSAATKNSRALGDRSCSLWELGQCSGQARGGHEETRRFLTIASGYVRDGGHARPHLRILGLSLRWLVRQVRVDRRSRRVCVPSAVGSCRDVPCPDDCFRDRQTLHLVGLNPWP